MLIKYNKQKIYLQPYYTLKQACQELNTILGKDIYNTEKIFYLSNCYNIPLFSSPSKIEKMVFSRWVLEEKNKTPLARKVVKIETKKTVQIIRTNNEPQLQEESKGIRFDELKERLEKVNFWNLITSFFYSSFYEKNKDVCDDFVDSFFDLIIDDYLIPLNKSYIEDDVIEFSSNYLLDKYSYMNTIKDISNIFISYLDIMEYSNTTTDYLNIKDEFIKSKEEISVLFSFNLQTIDDLLINCFSLEEILNGTLKKSSDNHITIIPEESFYIKRKKGVSDEKLLTKDKAKSLAKLLWDNDKEQKIRIGEMAHLVYAELYNNGYDKQLPQDPMSLKEWIKEVAPSYAQDGGRPKKQ